MESDIHRIMEHGEDALQASRNNHIFNHSFHHVYLIIGLLGILA